MFFLNNQGHAEAVQALVNSHQVEANYLHPEVGIADVTLVDSNGASYILEKFHNYLVE